MNGSEREVSVEKYETWQSRAGDRMAQAIANLVHLGRIDCRSEASDAMLDYMGKRGVPEPTVKRVLLPQPAPSAQPKSDLREIAEKMAAALEIVAKNEGSFCAWCEHNTPNHNPHCVVNKTLAAWEEFTNE